MKKVQIKFIKDYGQHKVGDIIETTKEIAIRLNEIRVALEVEVKPERKERKGQATKVIKRAPSTK